MPISNDLIQQALEKQKKVQEAIKKEAERLKAEKEKEKTGQGK